MRRPDANIGRRELLLLLALTAAGGWLRVWTIGQKGLWLDEAFSVWVATQPLGPLLAFVAQIDQHPPLYYLLLHFWIALVGDGPAAVRLLSALLSTLTIPATFCLGRRLFGPTVGLLAALILALSPFHVRFAQETRMYALLALNATLALLALTYVLRESSIGWPEPRGPASDRPAQARPTAPDRPAARRCDPDRRARFAWAVYIIFTAATLLTHNTAIFFLLAVNLFVLGAILWRARAGRTQPATHDPQPAFRRRWLLAQLGVLLLWSPWLAPFVAQASGVDREFWIARPTAGVVLAALKAFLSALLPELGGWEGAIWAGYAGLMLLGIVHLRRHRTRLALAGILLVVPFAGELLVSLRRPIFSDRTLIWAAIPLYLLLAAGIARLRRSAAILVATALIAAVNTASLHNYYVNFQKEGWDQAAAYVAARADANDLLLFNATWTQIPFDYYCRACSRITAEHGAPVDLFERGVLEPKMTEADLPRLRALIADRPRVWLIYSHNWYTDPQGLIPAALEQEFALLEAQHFVGVEVRLYGR